MSPSVYMYVFEGKKQPQWCHTNSIDIVLPDSEQQMTFDAARNLGIYSVLDPTEKLKKSRLKRAAGVQAVADIGEEESGIAETWPENYVLMSKKRQKSLRWLCKGRR